MIHNSKVQMKECIGTLKVSEEKFDEIRRYIHTCLKSSLIQFGPLRGSKYEIWLSQTVFPILESQFHPDIPKKCFANPRSKPSMCIRRLLMLEKQYYRRKAKLTK